MEKIEASLFGCLFGLAIGDALGVPVEFKSREYLTSNPIEDFIGFGTHSQKPGTFSDDTSLSFCLVESLIEGYSLNNLVQKFVDWKFEGFWTAYGHAFDCGIATSEAIDKLERGHSPKTSGLYTEKSNGNGSLMRISPLAIYVFTNQLSLLQRFKLVKEISGITHAHNRSIYACLYLTEFSLKLLQGETKEQAFKTICDEFNEILIAITGDLTEVLHFKSILSHDFPQNEKNSIKSSGYVIDTLEASIWSFLNSTSYESAVLTSVNLGNDSDTVGCITGGLAGLYYGIDSVPTKWAEQIARTNDIHELAKRFKYSLGI